MKKLMMLLALLTVIGSIGFASAYREGPFFDEEKHSAVEDVIESGSFEEWQELMPEQARIRERVNEENFEAFRLMHEAMEDGNYEEATRYRSELGFGGFNGRMGNCGWR